MAKIIVKAPDGKMGFVDVEGDLYETLYLTEVATGREVTLVQKDWCAQFSGPSIPVYEEVIENG